jgi:hypothetical protein
MRGALNAFWCWSWSMKDKRHSSFAITSNRGVDEWLTFFDDPLLGNSALDPLAKAAHHLVIEGPSHRAKLSPKHRPTEEQP